VINKVAVIVLIAAVSVSVAGCNTILATNYGDYFDGYWKETIIEKQFSKKRPNGAMIGTSELSVGPLRITALR
jgi:hypothetical protein